MLGTRGVLRVQRCSAENIPKNSLKREGRGKQVRGETSTPRKNKKKQNKKNTLG